MKLLPGDMKIECQTVKKENISGKPKVMKDIKEIDCDCILHWWCYLFGSSSNQTAKKKSM